MSILNEYAEELSRKGFVPAKSLFDGTLNRGGYSDRLKMLRQFKELVQPTVHGDGTITVTVRVWEMHRRDDTYPTRYYAFVTAHQQGRSRRGRFGRGAKTVHDLFDVREHVVRADTLEVLLCGLDREVTAVLDRITAAYLTADDGPPVSC